AGLGPHRLPVRVRSDLLEGPRPRRAGPGLDAVRRGDLLPLPPAVRARAAPGRGRRPQPAAGGARRGRRAVDHRRDDAHRPPRDARVVDAGDAVAARAARPLRARDAPRRGQRVERADRCRPPGRRGRGSPPVAVLDHRRRRVLRRVEGRRHPARTRDADDPRGDEPAAPVRRDRVLPRAPCRVRAAGRGDRPSVPADAGRRVARSRLVRHLPLAQADPRRARRPPRRPRLGHERPLRLGVRRRGRADPRRLGDQLLRARATGAPAQGSGPRPSPPPAGPHASLNGGRVGERGARRAGRDRRRRFFTWLVVITLLALAWRIAFAVIFKWDQLVTGDAYFYHHQANGLVDGHGFYRFLPHSVQRLVPNGPAADHPPLYPLYLAVFSLFGGRSFHVHMIASCLLGAATVFVCGLLGREVAGGADAGERAGIVAAVVAAVYANLWIQDPLVTSESITMLMVAISVLLAYRLWRAPNLWRAVWFGVACGLASLTRAEVI